MHTSDPCPMPPAAAASLRPAPAGRACRHRRGLAAALAAGLLVAGGAATPRTAAAVVTIGDAAAVAAAPRPDGWPAPDLSAVARLANGCSAVLLAGGRHLLGAAHCSAGEGAAAVLASGERLSIASLALAPGWSGRPGVHDLAVMTLAQAAGTPGLRLASLAQIDAAPAVLVAGYGAGGTPAAPQPAGTLGWGYNEYDAPFTPADWTGPPPPVPPIRLFDFDDGRFAANTLGLRPGGHSSLGLGAAEAMLAGLDSGGPSLVAVRQGGGGWFAWLRREPVWSWRIAAIHVGIDGTRGAAPGGVGMDLLAAPWVRWIAGVVGVDPSVLVDAEDASP